MSNDKHVFILLIITGIGSKGKTLDPEKAPDTKSHIKADFEQAIELTGKSYISVSMILNREC